MAKIFRKTRAVIIVSNDVKFSEASASVTVLPFSFEYWHCCKVYKTQLQKSSDLAKKHILKCFMVPPPSTD